MILVSIDNTPEAISGNLKSAKIPGGACPQTPPTVLMHTENCIAMILGYFACNVFHFLFSVPSNEERLDLCKKALQPCVGGVYHRVGRLYK